MKNYGDLRGCYPPWPTTLMDNTLLDLHTCNSSQDTQPHSLIVNYQFLSKNVELDISMKQKKPTWIKINQIITTYFY